MNDDDEYDDDEEEFQGPGIVNEMDFFTWDLIIKNTPKLPQIELLLHKNQIKNKKFFTQFNDFQYNPPFLVFYEKKTFKEEGSLPQDISIGNFHEVLGIPHWCELMKFYEELHLMKYPKNPILMCKRKCKF